MIPKFQVLVWILLAVSVLAGCGERSSSTATGPVRQLRKSDLTDAEIKYGIAPVPDSSVTYQPDVIVVGGGARSIRAQSGNGFVWTIDADAPRANELAPGKVLFMTSRAVGRVLAVRKEGDGLTVVLGPVELTDIVQKADIHLTDVPLDFGEAIAYETSDLPLYTDMRAAMPPQDPGYSPAVFMQTSGAPNPAPQEDAPDVSNLVNFKTRPFASTSAIGVQVHSDGGGLKVSAQASVKLSKPKLDVVLRITPSGGITEASVELRGTAGLYVDFSAGTDVGRRANVNGILEPNIDFSIPVGGIGPLPLTVTLRQRFMVETAFGVRNSTITATGDYSFDGGFKMGYFNSKWNIAGPVGFHAKQSMLQSAKGISIAATGVNLTHQLRVLVGVGVGGFAVGPYVSFTSAVGLFKGSDLGMIACKEATLVVSLRGGVGYSIPQVVTNFINSILRTLNISYEVRGHAGIESQTLTILNSSGALKGCNAGAGAADT